MSVDLATTGPALEAVLPLFEDPATGEGGAELAKDGRSIRIGARSYAIRDGIVDFLDPALHVPSDRMSGFVYDLLVWRFGLRWKLWVRSKDLFAFRDRLLGEWDRSGPFLDCPSGTGFAMAQKLGPDGPFGAEAPYVAVDHSIRWLRRAASRARKAGARHAVLVRADVSRLPFSDQVFTGLLSINGLHCFPDLVPAAREFHRVLRQGAHFGMTAVAAGVEPTLDLFIERMHRKGVFAEARTQDAMENDLLEGGLKVDARFIGKLAAYEGRA